jgi:hypothetical protein
MTVEHKRDNIDLWAYRTSADVETDIATINNAATYSTTTYAYAIYVDGVDFIDIAMKCTVPDAAISGDLTFSWLLTNNATYPTIASFTSKMTPVRNITACRGNQAFDVRGYKYLKVLSVTNSSGQTLTNVNAEVTGKG